MADRVTVHDAKTNLSELLQRVEAGEEIVIARGDKPVAILSAYATHEIATKRRQAFGSLVGKFEIPADDVLLSQPSQDELGQMFGEAAELFK